MWYIGQPVVAVRDHPGKYYKKGDEFKIQGLRQSPCKCKLMDLDIGQTIPNNVAFLRCDICSGVCVNEDNIFWHQDVDFAPLDGDISELLEVLKNKEVKT